jgi:hypothetical protein
VVLCRGPEGAKENSGVDFLGSGVLVGVGVVKLNGLGASGAFSSSGLSARTSSISSITSAEGFLAAGATATFGGAAVSASFVAPKAPNENGELEDPAAGSVGTKPPLLGKADGVEAFKRVNEPTLDGAGGFTVLSGGRDMLACAIGAGFVPCGPFPAFAAASSRCNSY